MATVIDPRVVLDDDSGTPSAPVGDGTTINNALFQDLQDAVDGVLAGDVEIGGDFDAPGDGTFGGLLSAVTGAFSGLVNFVTAAFSGAVTMASTLVVSGVTTINAALNASGLISGSVGFAERGRGVALGEWTDVSFTTADYEAVGTGVPAFTVVSGNVLSNSYTLIGKTMLWSIWVNGFTVSNVPADYLTVRVPAGLTVVGLAGVPCARGLSNGVSVSVIARVLDSTHIFLFREDGLDWPNSAGNNTFEVQIPMRLA